MEHGTWSIGQRVAGRRQRKEGSLVVAPVQVKIKPPTALVVTLPLER
jgi:hypothetical protein